MCVRPDAIIINQILSLQRRIGILDLVPEISGQGLRRRIEWSRCLAARIEAWKAMQKKASTQSTAISSRLEMRSPEAEIALIERVCAGEKHLFYDLICPYERSVYLLAYSLLRNQADAAEVIQQAFLKAFCDLTNFRRESKFRTWLIQIAINEAKLKLRKERKAFYESIDEQQKANDGKVFPKDFADWREIPSESLERAELRQALQRAIGSLEPIYREVFVLRDVEELSISETARILGISEASVKTRLLRARLQMRDALAPGFDGAWRIGDSVWKKTRPW